MAKKKRNKKTDPEQDIIKDASSAGLVNGGPVVTDGRLFVSKRLFWGISAIFLVVMLLMSLGSGTNSDDDFQNRYADNILSFYTSGGQDTSALYHPRGPIKYYGGFYEIQAAMVNSTLGYTNTDAQYHNVRHMINAFYGWLTMLALALLIKSVTGSYLWGLLSMLFLFLSPRFLGHSFMNPKDIPFAAGYMITLLAIYKLVRALPRINKKWLFFSVLGLGAAFGVRAGAVILMFYFGLVLLLRVFEITRASERVNWKNGIIAFLSVVIGGYIMGVLFWPYALQNPFLHPYLALSEFSQFSIGIRILHDGANIMSGETSRWYPLVWIYRTVPLFIFVGLIAAVLRGRFLLGNVDKKALLLLSLGAFFPLFITVYQNSVLYDGWRHLTFMYAPLVGLVTLGIWSLFQINNIQKYWLIALGVIVGITLVEPALFIAKNHAYPYVYFNPVSGGTSSAFGKYELDYYGLSVRQGMDYLEEQGLISEGMDNEVVIATTASYNAQRLIKKYNKKVKVKYTRFYSRFDKPFDFGIFPTRFVRAGHLLSGAWASGEVIKEIKVDGVPISVIIDGRNTEIFNAVQAYKANDYTTAERLFKDITKKEPLNDVAWSSLGNIFFNQRKFAEAEKMLLESTRLYPEDVNTLNILGLTQLNLGKLDEAENTFLKITTFYENYAPAYYYMAVVNQNRNDNATAIRLASTAVKYNPRFKEAYQLLSTLHAKTGNQAEAKRFMSIAQQL